MQINLRGKNFKHIWAESFSWCVCVCVRVYVISRVRILNICGRNQADGVCVCVRARARVCGRWHRLSNLTCNETVEWQVFSYDKLCQLNSLVLTFYILHISMTKIKSKLKLS